MRNVTRSHDTPEELFLAVGKALSWWEAAEDELLGLYRQLVRNDEEKVSSYIKKTCNPRKVVLTTALAQNVGIFEGREFEQVKAAIEALSKLINRRNQISHGHCAHVHHTQDGVVVREGSFLVPAWGEGGFRDRGKDLRFALTVADIDAFEKEVREHRWIILNISREIVLRRQACEQAEIKARLGMSDEL